MFAKPITNQKVRIKFKAANGENILSEMDLWTWEILKEQIDNALLKNDWSAVFAVLALGIKTKSIIEIKESENEKRK